MRSQPTRNTLKVLIVVGGVDAEEALGSSELLEYSRAGATWSPSTPLPAPMWGARGALLGGRFLLVGGYARSRSYQDSVLAWDSVSQVFLSAMDMKRANLNLQTWEAVGNLFDGRYYHAVANIPTHSHINQLCQP